MVKIQARRSVHRTVNYFLRDSGLAAEEKIGRWIGTGAMALGLGSDSTPYANGAKGVEEADLAAVLSGYGPPSSRGQAGRRLNGRYVPSRRCAWDLVFTPHKSLSVAGLCLPHESLEATLICDAFALAVGDTFAFVETLALRNNGSRPDVATGSLVGASFMHQTSRRTDPHLHNHILIANATRDISQARREWYGLETLRLYRQTREIDMILQRETHRRLRANGLDSRLVTIDGIPVAILPAVSPTICRRVSQAHQAILAETQDRWSRAHRTIHQKRHENVVNDRLRPRKVPPLLARSERFIGILNPAEIAAIAADVQLPTANTDHFQHRPELAPSIVKDACKAGIALMGDTVYSPRAHTLAAWFASMLHPMEPFDTFRRFIVENAGMGHTLPTDPQTIAMHISDQEQAQVETDAYLAAQRDAIKGAASSPMSPGMAQGRWHPIDTPSAKTRDLDSGRGLKSESVQGALQPHAKQPQDREGVSISEYWLPPPPEDSEDVPLGPSL